MNYYILVYRYSINQSFARARVNPSRVKIGTAGNIERARCDRIVGVASASASQRSSREIRFGVNYDAYLASLHHRAGRSSDEEGASKRSTKYTVEGEKRSPRREEENKLDRPMYLESKDTFLRIVYSFFCL